jgi:UDP-2,4-diacetamido-2,4,6-trideoxy-beta-L-altropyranose hydrolase
VPKNCELLLGSQYAMLRPEFAKWRPYSIERRSKPEFKQLLINMGGVDVDNVTGQLINELRTCNLPNDINIVVVMGGSAPHLENIRAIVSTLPYKTAVKVGVDNMAEIMANSDVAIGAAGATTWERCCLGLPTIQIVIAENQNTIAKSLAKKNAIKLLQDRKELSSMINDVISWMKDVSDIAQQISDGLGLTRVVSVIIDKKL